MTNAQVIPMRRPHRTQVVQPLLAADNTGNRPILCLCKDGSKYWCKNYSDDWPEVPVNEIVSAEVGKALGAPVLDWAVVDVPASLAGRRVGNAILSRRPMFGSLEKMGVEHSYDISSIHKDGNADRIPYLAALWYLCNAEDIQMLYCLAEDEQIWSLDHGYWFGSHEGPRGLYSPSERAGRPDTPAIGRGTSPKAWESAMEAVSDLTHADLAHIANMIPTEWAMDPSEVNDMIAYVLQRVPYTLSTLDDHARTARKEG